MKILMISAEAAPWVKTGGLGLALGELTAALSGAGHDVRVVLPGCAALVRPHRSLGAVRLQVPLGGQSVAVSVTGYSGAVPLYVVEAPGYFDRTEVYGGQGGYGDNDARFVLFCRSVLQWLQNSDFRPELLHLHDWPAALVPALQRTEALSPAVKALPSLLTIHNLRHRGLFALERLAALGLDPHLGWYGGVEFHGELSLLKGGVQFASAVNTVSPTYAREALSAEHGWGFEGMLAEAERAGRWSGILNGLDARRWDPAVHAPSFGPQDLRPRQQVRRRLRAALGLPAPAGATLAAMVARLDEQKGFDLLLAAYPALRAMGVQLVVMGDGDPRYLVALQALEKADPHGVRRLPFEDQGARELLSAAELFLMPSLFEPCGLAQLQAMRFGAVPVVRSTGGLCDTVLDAEAAPGRGWGFTFAEPSAAALSSAVSRALAYRSRPDAWRALVRRAMTQPVGWEAPAAEYLALYRRLVAAPPRQCTV